MKEVFGYIVGLGAPVMMPIIFTILGVCIGIKLGKALKSGLLVGVGFVGLSIVTALLTTALGPALNSVVDIYDLQLKVFDMGWPAAASIAYNTSVGALIIPICLGVNLLMLLTRTTKTVNIDLWNYWHFAFIGALAYFATHSLLWGFFAAVICYIITLVIADFTAKKFQKFYKNMDGISIPQPFCAGFVPFAWVINKGLDKIPGVNKINIDSEGMKQKFGLMGEPLFLGVVIGCVIGAFARYELPKVLMLGVQMGAVMELIPRITGLFIEGLLPISNATKSLIDRKFKKSAGLNIGMSPALASLAGMFYVFPLILPITKGNVFKTFIIGLILLVGGVYIVTNLAPVFTLAAQDVYAMTQDTAVRIPDGFSEAAAIDFASSPFTWVIYHLTASIKIIGPVILGVCTLALMLVNRRAILRQHRQAEAEAELEAAEEAEAGNNQEK